MIFTLLNSFSFSARSKSPDIEIPIVSMVFTSSAVYSYTSAEVLSFLFPPISASSVLSSESLLSPVFFLTTNSCFFLSSFSFANLNSFNLFSAVLSSFLRCTASFITSNI